MLKFSIVNLCCILMMVVLTGCTTTRLQSSFQQQRDQQQVVLARALEALWERGHIIPSLQRGAPLTSTSEQGRQAILTQNQNNLALVQAELGKLDQRLEQRRAAPVTGDMALLEVSNVTDDKQVQYRASPLTIYRGEQRNWSFVSQQGRHLALRVVWSEAGNLYIEGQDLLDLSPASSDVPLAKQVFYYGEEILAQASFSMVLQTQVPRVE